MLVNTEWLKEHQNDSDLVIIDTRPKIAYTYGHIKNSHCMTIEKIIQTDQYGSNLVCEKGKAEEIFGQIGIDEAKKVLVCGEYMDPSVARMAWTLLYFGHQNTLILENGVSNAKQSGIEFSRAPPKITSTEFQANVNGGIRIESDDLNANIDNYTIIDARTIQEFMSGHLPKAILIPFTDGIGQNGKHFQDPEYLKAMFEQKGIKKENQIICYCMHGHRASSLFFQLKQAGYDPVKLYDGSFVEWHGKKLPLD